MTRKLMVTGVLALGLALIWALLTWDPVDRTPESETTAATAPEAAPTTGPVAQPATPAASPSQPVARTPEPAAPATSPSAPTEPAQDDAWPVPESSGPVAELKRIFEAEPRASSAVAAESAVHTGFEGPAVKPALLESVLCHTTICRVRMRWTKDRALGFMAGLMHVITDPVDGVHFEQNLAIDHPSDPNAAGERTIDVYLKLQPQ